eukprot:2278244-Karenia_brevis.AAC.1
MAAGQYGAVNDSSTTDVFWALALRVEASLLEGSPLYGFTVDYTKCFDMLPHSIILTLAGEMGMPSEVLRPLSSMYRQLRRRFRANGGCGREYVATNGILQGCPLSILLLSALVSVWSKAVQTEVPQVCTDAYVDDTGGSSCKACYVQSALDITAEYASITGQF